MVEGDDHSGALSYLVFPFGSPLAAERPQDGLALLH